MPEARDKILREATRIFALRGFTDAKTADICAASEVTKPMLYYYFGDKEGLFRAVLDEGFARVDARVAEVERRATTPAERLTDLAEAAVEIARSDPDLCRLLIGTCFGPASPVAGERIRRIGERLYRAFAESARAAVAAGDFSADAEDVASAVYGAVNLYVMAHLAEPQAQALAPGLGRRVVDLIVNGARARAAAAARASFGRLGGTSP
jgi:AcrR family transcriptional regulator